MAVSDTWETIMAKYLLLKHYRGDHEIAYGGLVPMDQWKPEEIAAHMDFMGRVAEELRQRGFRHGGGEVHDEGRVESREISGVGHQRGPQGGLGAGPAGRADGA